MSEKYREQFYDEKRREYFIDRHRRTFEVIANFINNAKWGADLIRPDDIPIDVFVTELAFYSLGRETVENFLKNEGLLRDGSNSQNESESTNHRAYIWKMCEDPVTVLIVYKL